ncbi:virus tail fibre assembly protein, lambda gpK [Rosenbergiella nectarea]|uniref:Virus tail fibre assembly protein, lambda gpK n=1 Tax=Rosenbergiella nectarea TaxID=988801 RepID=A0A1H9EZ77_9GAMM|nr:tail fiber assembly protein [Rosenbergiella nectarea]SEQ30919.1 virus tail fibre assembly protein, lambda gpK [Rosenbergiella nectarea]
MTKYNTELPLAKLNESGIAVQAGWLTVYCIEPSQNEFASVTMEYLPVGVGLPALGFSDKPELPGAGFALIRSQDGKSWESKPDYRGETAYNTTDRQPEIIQFIGELPGGMTLLTPKTNFDNWNGQEWVTDIKAIQAAAISAADNDKATRLREAQNRISDWQTELQLDVISEGDKAKLVDWMSYIKALNAIDTSTAPDINWPQAPTA